MRLGRTPPPALELDALPVEVRRAVEAAMTGAELRVRRRGRDVGSLTFRAAVLEGVVLAAPRTPAPEVAVPDGVTVVATAMRLSPIARTRLGDELGPDYAVFDLHDAPASTDVLLVNAVSPQLLSRLQDRFPRARVLVTEIEDDELGVAYAGPVGRLMDAGAAAYLPPRDLGGVAAGVHAYLGRSGHGALTGAGRAAGPALDAITREIAPRRSP
jgi:hypothetical protein